MKGQIVFREEAVETSAFAMLAMSCFLATSREASIRLAYLGQREPRLKEFSSFFFFLSQGDGESIVVALPKILVCIREILSIGPNKQVFKQAKLHITLSAVSVPSLRKTSTVKRAVPRISYPPRKTVRNIRNVTMRRYSSPQIPRSIDRPRIIYPRRPIKSRNIRSASLIQTLRQSIPPPCTTCPLLDHVRNRLPWTWFLRCSSIVTRRRAVVILHEARIGDSVIRCWGSDTAAGLLHYYCKNEAVIDKCGGGDELDGFIYVYDFLVSIEVDVELAARPFHVPSAVVEPGRSSVTRNHWRNGYIMHISRNEIHLSFAGQPSSVEPFPL